MDCERLPATALPVEGGLWPAPRLLQIPDDEPRGLVDERFEGFV
jgi:hypothetical protein